MPHKTIVSGENALKLIDGTLRNGQSDQSNFNTFALFINDWINDDLSLEQQKIAVMALINHTQDMSGPHENQVQKTMANNIHEWLGVLDYGGKRAAIYSLVNNESLSMTLALNVFNWISLVEDQEQLGALRMVGKALSKIDKADKTEQEDAKELLWAARQAVIKRHQKLVINAPANTPPLNTPEPP